MCIYIISNRKFVNGEFRNSGRGSSKTTEIYPVGYDYINYKISLNILLSNGVNTHVTRKQVGNITNPIDDFG